MSDTKDQGITVTEIAAMDQAVDVAAETTAAFAGRALRGPLNIPILVDSYAAFEKRFGGIWHRSNLAPAVKQFFEHGGARLYIVRIANNARGAMIALPATGGVLVLHALEPGSTERIRAAVDYDGIDDADTEHFNLVVQRIAPATGMIVDQEIFTRVCSSEESRNFIGSAMLNSRLVSLQFPLPVGRPQVTVDENASYRAGYVGHAQRGSDGLELSDYDLIGSGYDNTGIFSLNQVEYFDLLYLPPPTRELDIGPAAVLAAEQYCHRRGAMLILDPLASWTTVERALDGVRHSGFVSPDIVSYYPRVRERSARSDQQYVAGGALAGLLCKLDRQHGPWEDLDQLGMGLSRNLLPAADINVEQARQLVREGLNVIAGQAAGCATICGSVTLGRGTQMDRKFSSLTVRRLCLMITNQVERATRWAVFEPLGQRVTERIHGQVDGYMSYLANSGAFSNDHFIVQCETELRSDAFDPDRGVNILLAFRPAGTDEDITLTLHQTIAGCRVAVTAFAPVAVQVA